MRAFSVHHLHTFISNPCANFGALILTGLAGMLPNILLPTSCLFQKRNALFWSLVTFLITSDTFCPSLCTVSVHWWNNDFKADSHCDVTTYTYIVSSSGSELLTCVVHSTRSLWSHNHASSLKHWGWGVLQTKETGWYCELSVNIYIIQMYT